MWRLSNTCQPPEEPDGESSVRSELPEGPSQLPHATLDARIGLLEHRRWALDGIPDRAGLDSFRVKVTQDQDVAPRTPEAVTDLAALGGVHNDDEVRGARAVGRQQLGPVRTEIHAVTRGHCDRSGRRRPPGAHEAGGVDAYPVPNKRGAQQGGGERATAQVTVTDHEHGRRAVSAAQRPEGPPAAQRVQDAVG